MKILFVNTSLVIGGISTSLINYFELLKDVKNLQIDVIFLMKDEIASRYRVLTNVNEIELKNKYLYYFYNKKKGDWIYRSFMHATKKIVSKARIINWITYNYKLEGDYDVAISFRNDEYTKAQPIVCHCEDFVLRHVNAKKKIAWIHNDPVQHGITYDIAKIKYNGFDSLAVVSKGCKESLERIVPEYSDKIKVVYNPINYKEIYQKIKASNPYSGCEDDIIFVTVGRIQNKQKKIDRILEIAKMLQVHNINNYKWYIVGDGEDFSEIKEKIDDYKVNEHIILSGEKENPFVYMKFADYLVVTSSYEGFSIVTMEALICNTPVVTTNHTAAKELIINAVNGFIVENDIESIYEKIVYLIQNRNEVDRLRENIATTLLNKDCTKQQFFELIGYSIFGDREGVS